MRKRIRRSRRSGGPGETANRGRGHGAPLLLLLDAYCREDQEERQELCPMPVGGARVAFAEGIAEGEPGGDQQGHERGPQVVAYEVTDPAVHGKEEPVEKERLGNRQDLPDAAEHPGKGSQEEVGEALGEEEKRFGGSRDVGLLELARRAHRVPVPDVLQLLEAEGAE